MGRTLVYPKAQKNTIHREEERGKIVFYMWKYRKTESNSTLIETFIDTWSNVATYDLHTIHSIINNTSILHVSFNSPDTQDPWPTILPMIGTMGSFAYPSADLNDPLYVWFRTIPSSSLAEFEPQDVFLVTRRP